MEHEGLAVKVMPDDGQHDAAFEVQAVDIACTVRLSCRALSCLYKQGISLVWQHICSGHCQCCHTILVI